MGFGTHVGGGGSHCTDTFEPWLLVRFSFDGRELQRCAQFTGIDAYDWPLDMSMRAVQQRIEPYEIGGNVTVWTTRVSSHCIVGYGSLDLLKEKMDWLWASRQRSCNTLVCFGVVTIISFAVSLCCGLCSTPAAFYPKYSLLPTEPQLKAADGDNGDGALDR